MSISSGLGLISSRALGAECFLAATATVGSSIANCSMAPDGRFTCN